MKKSRQNRRFESLESRQMMAGDVSAVLQNGSLYLSEAAGQAGQNNGVLISQLANGQVRVQGTAVSGMASKINGQAFQDFTVTDSLLVNFGAGSDRVEFGPLGSLLTLKSVNLNLGAQVLQPRQTDNDTISLTNFQTTASLSIQTGLGHDVITITGGTVGNYASNDQLWIKTGAGADYVSIQATHIHGALFVQTFDLASEADADSIYIDKYAVVIGDATMLLGGGADAVYIGDANASQGYEYSVDFLHSLTIDTGAGNDTVSMYNPITGGEATDQTNIQMGAGVDQFKIDGPHAWLTNLNLQTFTSARENDADVVQVLHGVFGLSASIKMGGGADHFFAGDPAAPIAPAETLSLTGPMFLDMGTGDDVVFMQSIDSFPEATLTIRTGAGKDTVTLSDSSGIGSVDLQTYANLSDTDADTVTISGVIFLNNFNVRLGGGNDQLTLDGVFAQGNISLDAGAGDDLAKLDTVTAIDNLMANLGDGNDTLNLVRIGNHNVSLLGGNGFDRLNKSDQPTATTFSQTGWELYNGLFTPNPPRF